MIKIPIDKSLYKLNKIHVNGNVIQTYSFGTGKKKILSFPAYPHSGLIYFYYLYSCNLSKVNVLTFDLPGWVGNSTPSKRAIGYDEDLVLDIADRLTDEYEFDKYSVLGYSFGTSLSVRHSANHLDRVDKVALISPLLNGPIAQTSQSRLLNFVNTTKTPWFLKYYVKHRFNKYRKFLSKQPLISEVLDDYLKLIQKADSKILFESIYHLFNTDYTEYIKQIPSEKLLVVSSKQESQFLRKQAEYLRRVIDGEKTTFLSGAHEDFVLKPNSQKANEIIDFLT